MILFKILLLTLVSPFLNEAPTQILSTSLTLTVRDELGNTVEGAAVTLFEKEEDYLSEKNGLLTEMTDKKGVAMFKKLELKQYYLIVRKGKADNRGGGEALALKKGRINKATVVIE